MALPVALITDVLGSVVNLVGSGFGLVPTRSEQEDLDRKIKLRREAEQGYSESQEDELRALGLNRAGAAEREAYARRADAQATLPGGVSVRDVAVGSALDAERASNRRIAVDEQVLRADLARQSQAIGEYERLLARDEARQESRQSGVGGLFGQIGNLAQNIGTGLAIGEDEGILTGAKGPKSYAEQLMSGNTGPMVPNAGQSPAESDVQRYIGLGFDTATAERVSRMTPEERQAFIRSYMGGL